MRLTHGVPLAVPFVTLNRQRYASAIGIGRPEVPTTLARSSVPARTLQRAGGEGGSRRVSDLSTRDSAILDSLKQVRLLTARQVERLHFNEGSKLTQTRRSRKTLARLYENGLLHRLERRVGGTYGGSSGFIYCLSARGQRLMRTSGPAGGTRRRRSWEPSAAFLGHILSVGELFVRLKEAQRQGVLELLDFTAEPYCWRTFAGTGGARKALKPDAFVAVAHGDFEHRSFVEVDLGTEGPTTLRNKLQIYLDYARTGSEQVRHDVFPRVLFLAPDEARVRRIIDALRSTLRRAPELCVVGRIDDTVELLMGARS